MSVTIERVESAKQLAEFISLPWQVYAGDPHWTPWLYFERLQFFDKKKNPFFEHAEADYFIARRDGRAVGTIAAILNHRHNQFHNENVAHFGVFELLDDADAGRALLDAAGRWARERGTTKIIGPMNLSTNDECGLLVGGYDTASIIMLPYNKPYYRRFLEEAGFQKAKDLLAWRKDLSRILEPGQLPEKLLRVVEKVKQRYNITVRPLNMRDWDNELERIKTIYNSAWQRNWGFVPMTDAEINHLAAALKPIIDPAIVFIAEKEGRPIGCSLALPNVNELLQRIRPGPSRLSSYVGAARLLLSRRRPDWIRVMILGVIAEFRGRGVDGMLYLETAKASVARGYKWADGSWILEDNEAMNRPIRLIGGEVYKRFRIYEKEV